VALVLAIGCYSIVAGLAVFRQSTAARLLVEVWAWLSLAVTGVWLWVWLTELNALPQMEVVLSQRRMIIKCAVTLATLIFALILFLHSKPGRTAFEPSGRV
jgi:hypothetical protein